MRAEINKFEEEHASSNVDISYKEKLKTSENLEKSGDIKGAIALLIECSQIIYKNYAYLDTFQPEVDREIIDFYRELYADILEKIANLMEKTKTPLEAIAEHYIRSALEKFEILNSKLPKKERLAYQKHQDSKVMFGEADSPFYKVKELLCKATNIYDELGSYYLSKNEFKSAYYSYCILGDIFLNEIDIGIRIEDDFLYSEEDIGFGFFHAGEAFLRASKVMKERFIAISYARPMISYLPDVSNKLFGRRNFSYPVEKISIICFEKAREIFYKIGERQFYLKSKDKLAYLKTETEDFEFVIIKAFIEIARQFSKNKAPFLRLVEKMSEVQESFVRDYFQSHINILIEDIAIAESTRTVGQTDLIIIRNDKISIKEAICEFKIWGRNRSHPDHSDLKVLNQLRSYLTDFENFGIILMINPNQSSIKDKYLEKIIKKDPFLINDSIEEQSFLEDTNFVNFKTKHFTDESKSKSITIYHFILNLYPLFRDLKMDEEIEDN